MGTYSMPDFWLGMILLTLFAVGLGWFPVGGIVDPASNATGFAKLTDQAQHMFLPGAHADARLPGRVRDRHALVAARHDA